MNKQQEFEDVNYEYVEVDEENKNNGETGQQR